ncbi:uncharacterized protein LOC116292448, partial [Actinia tenebrosa]|uniref:Uncharacterized protein LOC116292448 n=1 Tax=Actinia tenebrosa TaxID=6105 RepID=A0A6P8HGT6_ACTTE
MPDRCVVGGCGNENSRKNGISLHRIPFFGDDRPEAVRRRKKWVDFVLLTRKKWSATSISAICSDHFKAEDYARQFIAIDGQSAPNSQRLVRDDIGIVAIPSITTNKKAKPASESAAKRSRRM